MGENTSTEINKKRKTDDNKHINYYSQGKNLHRKNEKSSNNIYYKKSNKQDDKCSKNLKLSLYGKNISPSFSLNKNSNANVTESKSNIKIYVASNINSNNVNQNCRNCSRGKTLDLEMPSKIFISKSLKNDSSYNMDKKKTTQQLKIEKVGLSSNEYSSYNVPAENNTSYEHARKLNELWNIYVNELLELRNSKELSLETINDMELNGACVEIHKSRCSTYIGIKGIIVLETQNSFKIITPKNRVLILLKNKSVFIINIKEKQYYLHGVQLLRDPALKSSKKYKILQNRAI
ncbi:ribonuclease P protein subunit p29, putative [Plasmodium malariae]|uniref:Ribonuclease P protein subunit p29, putative n=1 Tax=Plasmodium malariae TaxID=5858 RepID=A0A1C3KZG9_PLAMA|nr:ribonuclease P protein subunit p29, putative [Plasmodium malariae]